MVGAITESSTPHNT